MWKNICPSQTYSTHFAKIRLTQRSRKSTQRVADWIAAHLNSCWLSTRGRKRERAREDENGRRRLAGRGKERGRGRGGRGGERDAFNECGHCAPQSGPRLGLRTPKGESVTRRPAEGALCPLRAARAAPAPQEVRAAREPRQQLSSRVLRGQEQVRQGKPV